MNSVLDKREQLAEASFWAAAWSKCVCELRVSVNRSCNGLSPVRDAIEENGPFGTTLAGPGVCDGLVCAGPAARADGRHGPGAPRRAEPAGRGKKPSAGALSHSPDRRAPRHNQGHHRDRGRRRCAPGRHQRQAAERRGRPRRAGHAWTPWPTTPRCRSIATRASRKTQSASTACWPCCPTRSCTGLKGRLLAPRASAIG